jgi:uncharacterized cysteine cluster protein YcgN (CxxCxxCC family)
MSEKFWENKSLEQLNEQEWEALCDGCGRCCLHKILPEGESEPILTAVSCKLLDLNDCKCSNYKERFKFVPECLKVCLDVPETFSYLPETCAYRLLFNGEKLLPWHPLISGNKESVHESFISVKHIACSENDVDWEEADLEDFII